MRSREKQRLEEWLRLERQGEESRAEVALSATLRSLPSVVAPSDFADRVLVASGLAVEAQRTPRQQRPWLWRLAFCAWLIAGFVAASFVGSAGMTLWRSGQVIDWGSRLIVLGSRFLTDVTTSLGGLFVAGRAVSGAMSGPRVLLVCLACALAAAILVKGLSHLIAQDRSYRHVHS